MGWDFRATVELGAARTVAGRLRRAGFAAYFAGGAVRDLLLGLSAEDFDVATSATPAEVLATFALPEFRTTTTL